MDGVLDEVPVFEAKGVSLNLGRGMQLFLLVQTLA